jgi:hypothetical protein
LSLVIGCGGDGGGGLADEVQGNWVSESGEYECAMILNFEGDAMEWKEACDFDDGSIGVEIYTGTFAVEGERVAWTWGSGSCEDADQTGSAKVIVQGDRLTLVTASGAQVFARVKVGDGDGSGTGKLEFGCFDDDDNFDSHDIVRY